MHITFFFLHTDDVRWVIGLLSVHLQVLVEGEEAELEEVFDDNSNLQRQEVYVTHRQNSVQCINSKRVYLK